MSPRRSRINSEPKEIDWELPEAPTRPHQVPYSPNWDQKKGVSAYILRMNRDVNRMHLQKGLFRLLKDHVLIIHLSVDVDFFGNIYGTLVVRTREDLHEVVRRFQRTTFYGRTMEFSEISPTTPVPVAFRRAVLSIFQERGRSQMLLLEMMRLFEEKYDQPVGVLDLLKMGDLVERFTVGETQMIRVLASALVWQTNLARQGCLEELSLASCSNDYCRQMSGNMPRHGAKSLTCFRVPLREFSPRVQRILGDHGNSMSLSTFLTCYESHFGLLVEDEVHGIYLEHLLNCVSGVHLQHLQYQSRRIVLIKEEEPGKALEESFRSSELRHFRREVMDMLIVRRQSAVMFSEFVQTYRMQYGKMCRVADFGCTRLAEVLRLFPEDIQVIGVGNNRIIMLTHKAQMRRFQKKLAEIKRMFGVQNIGTGNFAILHQMAFKRPFIPTDYGVCFAEDLLEMSYWSVVTTSSLNTGVVINKHRSKSLEEPYMPGDFSGNRIITAYDYENSLKAKIASLVTEESMKTSEELRKSRDTPCMSEDSEVASDSSAKEVVSPPKPRSFSARLALCFH